MCEPRARTGFSLVELLVVIGIVSLLAGLLLPVLQNAIVEAEKIACSDNQRQLYLALAMYGDEYAHYPTERAEYTRSPTNSENKGEIADLTDEDDSPLLSYVDDLTVLYCSVDHRRSEVPVPFRVNRTYSHPGCNTVDPVMKSATGNLGWEWNYDQAWGINYKKSTAGFHKWPVAQVAFILCDAQRFNMPAFLKDRRSFQPHDTMPDMHIWPFPVEPFRLARNMTAGDGHTTFVTGISSNKHLPELFEDGL